MEILKSISNTNNFFESKQILESKGLVVTNYEEDGVYMVKYDKTKSDMLDDDVLKCRGIIIDKKTNKLLCYPPEKSIDISLITDADKIIYQTFIDGTMINISSINGEWKISTRSNLSAKCKFYSDKSFSVLFNESSINLNYDLLDKTCCYTVVLQHPENRIVANYDKPSYVLVSVRRIIDGVVNDLDLVQVKSDLKELGQDIIIPDILEFNDLNEARTYVNSLPFYEQGLVLKTSKGRSKMRNPHYDYVKQMRGNTRNMRFNYLTLQNLGSVTEFLSYFPEYNELFLEYHNELYLVSKTLQDLYHKCYIQKTHDKLETIPYEYRPLCYELHGQYLKTRQPILWSDIINFVNNLPVPRKLFVINFKNRSEHENIEPVIN